MIEDNSMSILGRRDLPETAINIPNRPWDLRLEVGEHPIVVDLSKILGTTAYYTASTPTRIRFRQASIEIESEDHDLLRLVDMTVDDSVVVGGVENIGPVLLDTCSHGFSPRERCPEWPHA